MPPIDFDTQTDPIREIYPHELETQGGRRLILYDDLTGRYYAVVSSVEDDGHLIFALYRFRDGISRSNATKLAAELS